MSRDPLAWLDEHPEGNSDHPTYREQLALGLDNEHTSYAELQMQRSRRASQRLRRIRRLSRSHREVSR